MLVKARSDVVRAEAEAAISTRDSAQAATTAARRRVSGKEFECVFMAADATPDDVQDRLPPGEALDTEW